MNIFRVEHKDYLWGPYHDHFMKSYFIKHAYQVESSDFVHLDHSISWRLWPWHNPYNDNELFEVGQEDLKEWVCGFVSLDQFQKWFGADKKKLRMHGFHVKIYSVCHKFVRLSLNQVVFKILESSHVGNMVIR